MLTTQIRGRTVLAKPNGYAYTFANRTQAEKKAAEVGGAVWQPGRPFYVVLPDAR